MPRQAGSTVQERENPRWAFKDQESTYVVVDLKDISLSNADCCCRKAHKSVEFTRSLWITRECKSQLGDPDRNQ